MMEDSISSAARARIDVTIPRDDARDAVCEAMQRTGLLESPAPPAALRWIETFLDAYERLRDRQVLFFLDTVSQYVDDQAELRDLPVDADLLEIAKEFGIAPPDARYVVRMALTAREDGPPFALLFPLLGHDRIMMRIGAVNSHLLHGRGLEPIKFGPGGAPFEPIRGTRPSEPSAE
jgi:hypothetical protein